VLYNDAKAEWTLQSIPWCSSIVQLAAAILKLIENALLSSDQPVTRMARLDVV
jgi:hypothetical protein